MQSDRSRSATKLLFAFTLFILLFGQIFQHYFGENRDLRNGDFWVYFYAGRVLHADRHADLYQGATDANPQYRAVDPDSKLGKVALAAHADIGMYLYPPLLADILAPVSSVSAPLAGKLWKTSNILLILFGLLLLLRLSRVPLLSPETVVLIAAAYAFLPIQDAISMGQITIVMFALLVLAIYAYRHGFVVLSALAIALATAIKVSPVFIVPIFVIWKDRRWLISYFAGLLALVGYMDLVSGPANLASFLRVVSVMSNGIPIELNRCLAAVVAWVYAGHFMPVPPNGDPAPNPTRALALLIKAVNLLVLAAALYPVWRRRHTQTPASRALTIAIFALLAILIAPVSWRHAYVIAVIPLTLLWIDALRKPGATALRPALLALSTISVGTILFDTLAISHLPEPLRIAFASVGVLSCLALCLQVLYSREESAALA